MSYLDRLADLVKSETGPGEVAAKASKAPSAGFAGSPPSSVCKSQSELMALLDRVAAHYRCPPDEVVYMRKQAQDDPRAAWEALCLTAKAEGIQ